MEACQMRETRELYPDEPYDQYISRLRRGPPKKSRSKVSGVLAKALLFPAAPIGASSAVVLARGLPLSVVGAVGAWAIFSAVYFLFAYASLLGREARAAAGETRL
jgi:hypothetical protein